MDYLGTENWKVSRFERDSSKRSCFRIEEDTEKGATDLQLISNARLIEQAPELLKTCIDALESIEIYVKDGFIMKNTITENKLRKVIKKSIEG